MRVSVCMATYNGAEYVFGQLESIVDQLHLGDEIVIVDDCSTDTTLVEVERAISQASVLAPGTVTVLRNRTNRGHVATFERALDAASNDLLVLADQDDVWIPGYLSNLRALFMREPSVGLVVARPVFCDESLKPLEKSNERYRHPRINGIVGVAAFILNRAMPIGCTMSIRRTELAYLLPFPDGLFAHDHWLFAMATLRRRMRPLNDEAVYYRRHLNVVTHKRTPLKMVGSRLRLLRLLIRRLPMTDGRVAPRRALPK